MPIRRENRARYPKDWKQIRARIIERANGHCECMGECGKHQDYCQEVDGEKAINFKGKVHLAPAHQNHQPEDCRDDNLKAFCQRCHLGYDCQEHVKNRANTMSDKKRASGWEDSGWEE